jgi:hypothetical protein
VDLVLRDDGAVWPLKSHLTTQRRRRNLAHGRAPVWAQPSIRSRACAAGGGVGLLPCLVGTLAAAAVACGGSTEDAGASEAESSGVAGSVPSQSSVGGEASKLIEVGVGPCCLVTRPRCSPTASQPSATCPLSSSPPQNPMPLGSRQRCGSASPSNRSCWPPGPSAARCVISGADHYSIVTDPDLARAVSEAVRQIASRQ